MAVKIIMNKSVVLLVGILASLIFNVYADNGVATFYTKNNPSACFGSRTPTGLIAAASRRLWNNGKACRTRYRITCTRATTDGTPHPCTGGSVEVEVVDFCPDCPGVFDLSKDAFSAIADTDAGVIQIEYQRI